MARAGMSLANFDFDAATGRYVPRGQATPAAQPSILQALSQPSQTTTGTTAAPGVVNPLASGGGQGGLAGAFGGALGGVQTQTVPGLTTQQTTPQGTPIPGSQQVLSWQQQRTNPVSQQNLVQAALADYQAQVQGAQIASQQAQQALGLLQEATTGVPQNIQNAVTASRGRTSATAGQAVQQSQPDFERARTAFAQYQARSEELAAQTIDDVSTRWSDVLSGLQNDTALNAQQMVMGAREGYQQRSLLLSNMAASGQVNVTPQALQLAQNQLTEAYRGSLGNAVAYAATQYNQAHAQYGAAAATNMSQLQTAMNAMVSGAYGAGAGAELNMATVQANMRVQAEAEQQRAELQLVQLEAQAEQLRMAGYTAEANMLTSDAFRPYVGQLSPLLTSIYEMYEGNVQANPGTPGISGIGTSGGSPITMTGASQTTGNTLNPSTALNAPGGLMGGFRASPGGAFTPGNP